MRKDKINYYLDMAQTACSRSTCLRRKYGSVIVKDDEIVSTGYNGAPRGRKNCDDLGYCTRENLNIPRGERYEICRSVHSEQNAIISASRQRMNGSTIYIAGTENGEIIPNANSCSLCKKMIINAGISKVVIRNSKDTFTEIDVQDWIYNDESIEGKLGY